MRVYSQKVLNRLGWAGTGRLGYRGFPGQYPYRIAFRYYRNLGARPEFLYLGKPSVSAYKKMTRYLRKNLNQLLNDGSTVQYMEFIQSGIILSGNIRLRMQDIPAQCVPNYHYWKFLGHGVHPVDGRMHIDLNDEVVPFRRGKHTVMVGITHLNDDQYEIVNDRYIPVQSNLINALKNCVRNR